MRDLHTETEVSPNGARVDLGPEPEAARPTPPELAHLDQQYRAVRRDQKIAGMAVMLLDAAKLLEPVVELLCDRALRWAALLSTVALSAYALRTPSWERLAIVATFALLAPWIIRRGRV